MDWSAKKRAESGEKVLVSLPDQITAGEKFSFAARTTRCDAIWHERFQVLAVMDAQGVEHNLRMRSAKITRFDGDPETDVQLEFLASASRGIESTGVTLALHAPGQDGRGKSGGDKSAHIRSQITGKVLKVLVKAGDTVATGDTLLVIEAMKMENRVFAPRAGKIATVQVKDGDAVQTGKELVTLAPA